MLRWKEEKLRSGARLLAQGVDIPGFCDRLLVFRASRPLLLRPVVFLLASLLLLSWPARRIAEAQAPLRAFRIVKRVYRTEQH